VKVYGYDSLLSDDVIQHFDAKPLLKLNKNIDAVIIAVKHAPFRKMSIGEIHRIINNKPELIDVRGIVDARKLRRPGSFTGNCEISY